MNHQTDEWRDLADAVILKAVEDYRHTIKQLRAKPKNKGFLEQKAEIEEFFLSSWFAVLTNLDGKNLLLRLQSEMKDREGKEE